MRKISPLLPPLCLALAVLVTLLWRLPNQKQELDVPMPAAHFNSLSFAPYRPGQSPLTGSFPSAAEVDADLALLAGKTRAIRTYAAIEGEYDVAALARRHGLKLWQGIWLGNDPAQNAREIAAGIAAAQRYPDVVERVVVGNEVLLRRDLPPAALIAAIDQVRAAVTQPVTYADVWEFWQQFPEVAAHVDIVTIHLLPYWEDTPTAIDAAVAHVDAVYRQMAALFPGRKIAIGETGWPSRGRPRRDAVPGRVNAARFLGRFIALAGERGWDYNLIEAFDQDWKYASEGVVGANWGLWTAARQPKFPAAGGVAEDPAWPCWAAASIAAALLLLALGLASAPRLRLRRQAELAAAAFALGAAAGFALSETLPVLYDIHTRLAAAINLPAQALLAALLIRRLARRFAGCALPRARRGQDATRAARALLRLRRPEGWTATAWPDAVLDDLNFAFVLTALTLQLLLALDGRYRDFPFPTFAIPLAGIAIRSRTDLPRGDGGREEAWAGITLTLAASASAIQEGWLNQQSLAWTALALAMAATQLRRLRLA